METLVHLKGIDPENGKITIIGRNLGHFPLEPRMAAILLKSKELGCTEEVLNAISLINSGNWKFRPH